MAKKFGKFLMFSAAVAAAAGAYYYFKNLMKTDLTMTILITILILTKRKKISPAARNAAMYRFVSLP